MTTSVLAIAHPVSWLVINSLGSLFGAVVVVRLSSWFFTGARQLLLILVPFATYMASWVLAMPYFAITNTDMPTGVRMAAVLSMALGAIAIDGLIRIGTGQWRLLPPQTSETLTGNRKHAYSHS
jgi:hypothetical protein